jgi:uncharacterized protein YdaU (DUF1376 family)
MHYYPHNIPDFNNSTRHLTRVERSVYRDAIERYYDTECVLTKDLELLSKRLLCTSDEEKQALINILNEFFIETDEGYFHERCAYEISKYRLNTTAKAKAGKASALAKKQKLALVKHNSTHVEHTLNSVEQTKNYKPITNNYINKGSRLPNDWKLPDDFKAFCIKERPDLKADYIAEQFKDYWLSVSGSKGVKVDWFATWRNWVRNQKVQPTQVKSDKDWMKDIL